MCMKGFIAHNKNPAVVSFQPVRKAKESSMFHLGKRLLYHYGNSGWITKEYPLFRQLYQEIVDFRYHTKELITVYSEALPIMDETQFSIW